MIFSLRLLPQEDTSQKQRPPHNFEFDTQKWGPNVVQLQVHLPTTLDQDGHLETALTAYFKTNADTGEIGEKAHKHTFLEFSKFFVYNKSQWTLW